MDKSVVHIVDDDESIRLSLDRLLRSVGYHVQMHASSQEFLDAERTDAPSCLIVDVRLPGTGGLELQDYLTRIGYWIPVIVITGHGDIPMTVRAMKAGAIDFLAKPFRPQDLIDAVSHALRADAARRAELARSQEVAAKFAALSAREREVMALVCSGLMNKQVAGHLEISEVTVKMHRGAAMRKMGARTLAELVRMAEVLKLVRPA